MLPCELSKLLEQRIAELVKEKAELIDSILNASPETRSFYEKELDMVNDRIQENLEILRVQSGGVLH